MALIHVPLLDLLALLDRSNIGLVTPSFHFPRIRR